MRRASRWALLVCVLALPACGSRAPLSRAELEEACLVMDSCGLFSDGFWNVSWCLSYGDNDIPDHQARCVVDAQADCAAVQACLGLTRQDDPTCQPRCEGNVRVSCDGVSAWSMDCGLFPWSGGEVCLDDPDFGVVCGSGTGCTVPGFSCSGTKVQRCSGSGALLETDCAPSSCHDGRCSDAPLTPCDPMSVDSSCDGDVLVQCQEGLESRTNCRSFNPNWTCRTIMDAGVTYIGCDYEGTCSTWIEPTCDATSVVFCDQGSPVSLDCTSIGFTSCSGGDCQ